MSAKEGALGKQAAGTSRRGALKRLDGEPLTRHDLQYDLLSYIFNDTNAVFTDPFSDSLDKKVTFRDLYVSAIAHAPKTARSVREKFTESPVFSTDFAMLSLLANVGRVNTSMAFFPETRTALRTYHPAPALQRSDGNLTDAPRIRNALKSCILPSESKHVPNSPFSILAQREAGPIPTTSVVNLLFVLTQHTASIGNAHFADDTGLEFTDLFQPVPVPSAERGRAFLWVVYHYLESTATPNPFADPASTGPEHEGDGDGELQNPNPNPNVAPRMHRVDPSALAGENVDTQHEKEWGEKMSEHRRNFLAADRERQEAVLAARDEAGPSERGTSGTPVPTASKPIKPKGKPGRKALDNPIVRGPSDAYLKVTTKGQENLSNKSSLQLQPDGALSLAPTAGAAYQHVQTAPTSVSVPTMTVAGTGRGRGRKPKRGQAPQMQTEPYEFVYGPPSPERTMLQQAWHLISTKDVLYDSDDEVGDEHVRLDYSRRLQTLNRLRGKSPTPEPEPEPEPEPGRGTELEYQPPPTVMDVDDRW